MSDPTSVRECLGMEGKLCTSHVWNEVSIIFDEINIFINCRFDIIFNGNTCFLGSLEASAAKL